MGHGRQAVGEMGSLDSHDPVDRLLLVVREPLPPGRFGRLLCTRRLLSRSRHLCTKSVLPAA